MQPGPTYWPGGHVTFCGMHGGGTGGGCGAGCATQTQFRLRYCPAGHAPKPAHGAAHGAFWQTIAPSGQTLYGQSGGSTQAHVLESLI